MLLCTVECVYLSLDSSLVSDFHPFSSFNGVETSPALPSSKVEISSLSTGRDFEQRRVTYT